MSNSETQDNNKQLQSLQQEVSELRKKNADLNYRLNAYSQVNSSQVLLINKLVDKVPFGIILLDEHRKIIQVNAAGADIMDSSVETMQGEDYCKYFTCDALEEEPGSVFESSMENSLQQVSSSYNGKQLLHSAFSSDEGSKSIVIETFIDITEIKNAEQELINLAKIKDEFLGILSHELRTPLNAIQGYGSLLEEDIKDTISADGELYLEKIKEAGGLLLKVVNGLLELSDLTAGKLAADFIPIDIQMIISQLQYRFDDEFEKKGNKFIIESDDIEPFEQDLLMTMKVLYELLDNANKFTEEGEIRLSISLEKNENADWLKFRITDSGCGMTGDTMRLIFTAFHQADSSLTRSYQGLGLGLSIVEKIVQLIHGHIEVESHFGVGSTFTVLLPYKKILAA